jgi:hypothetical protein
MRRDQDEGELQEREVTRSAWPWLFGCSSPLIGKDDRCG